ncbi:hypothetical protein OIU34_24140 [Pararhizobium sp. BT-229]|uniref:hypothetical protein n=1 Tax=Pararhizobium sp. BT-229 TaxID=2986923 RepID=UPI0021F6ECA9|nr:hypothetical protein [Pararhizobium sp. BT-229]MCV9964990.1 hypothetical protein [Pararhizobium sp. BT-229]
MPRLTLPYLSSSLTSRGRTGKLKFGWSDTQVDVKEADPSEFRLAACRVLNGQNSFSVYECRGAFWASAMYPVRGVLFNADGIHGEERFCVESDTDVMWVRSLAQEVLTRRLVARGRKEGNRPGKDVYGCLKINSSLRPGDGHEADRETFAAWAQQNLVMADGRLMKRIHSPSVHVGWSFQGQSMTTTCRPVRGSYYIRCFGYHKFDPGLHFRLGDPAFAEAWAEAEAMFGVAVPEHELAHNRFYAHAIRDELAAKGLSDRMALHDNIAFDPSVLAEVGDCGWEDMGQRSAVSIAESIVSTSSPHLHQQGPKREALEELKRLVDIVPEDRPYDFQERLDSALASLPIGGEPARAWFVDRALDQWNDREIALSPAPHPGLRK